MIQLDYIAWQPIVHLPSGCPMGHEALARFREGLSPSEAFRQAGENAVLLDHICLRSIWDQAPVAGKIFVNVSPAFVRVGAWLWPPPRLRPRVVWELPEASGWEPVNIPAWLTVALDDVGQGHAELQRIAQTPWSFLKLDQTLVHDITASATANLIRRLVHIAHRRGAVIIAEGVETAEMAVSIQRLGVSYGQGYWLGRPQRHPLQIKEA